MLELLFWISAKKFVVSFALVGALLVSLAPRFSDWIGSNIRLDNNREKTITPERLENFFIKIGYGFVGLSITLFIIAGFIVDLK